MFLTKLVLCRISHNHSASLSTNTGHAKPPGTCTARVTTAAKAPNPVARRTRSAPPTPTANTGAISDNQHHLLPIGNHHCFISRAIQNAPRPPFSRSFVSPLVLPQQREYSADRSDILFLFSSPSSWRRYPLGARFIAYNHLVDQR